MVANNRIEKIAIVGAGGRMGGEITKALLAEGKHTVTAITRPDSDSKMPDGVIVKKVNYEDPAALADALKGNDALIITMNSMAPPEQSLRLVEAAAAADIEWVMPNWYGGDGHNTALVTDTMLGQMLATVTDKIKQLGKSNWVALACNFWYEWSLLGPPASQFGGFSMGPLMYGFDATNKSVTFFDEGEQKINTTTWPTAGLAVARLFALPVESEGSGPSLSQYKNDFAYVSSFLVSQKDMFESIKRVTGTSDSDWKITHEPTVERYQKAHKEFTEKFERPAFAVALYTRMFYKNGDGNFQSKHTLVNEAFGLPKDDLDAATKAAFEYSEIPY